MYFEGDMDETRICQIPIDSILNQEAIIWMVKESMRQMHDRGMKLELYCAILSGGTQRS